MFQAYKDLKNNSSQTRWKCIKFQIWTWWHELKWLPRHIYMRWKLHRLAKKHPDAYNRALHELKKMIVKEK